MEDGIRGITPDNKFLPDKQCYAHAFVLLAASSALLAGEKDAETLLKDALELFDKRFWDEKQGLTYDTWNTEFTVLDDYRGLNANMHTVEAFLAVADAIKEEKYYNAYPLSTCSCLIPKGPGRILAAR